MSSKQHAHKKSGLGDNPLSQSLFSKTNTEASQIVENPEKEDKKTSRKNLESRNKNLESRKKNTDLKNKNLDSRSENLENRFLVEIEKGSKESIGLQVTTDINDWLDGVVKVGRRKHGKKIPKQVWIQAGLELLRAMPVDWTEVSDLDDLRAELDRLSRVNHLENNL